MDNQIKTNESEAAAKIIVVGVGGGGNNAVNRMIHAEITSASFVAVNTDMKDLMMSNADEVIQIGKNLTKYKQEKTAYSQEYAAVMYTRL